MKQSLFLPALLLVMTPIAAFASSSSVLVPNSGTVTTNPYLPAPGTANHQAAEEAYKKEQALKNQQNNQTATTTTETPPSLVQPANQQLDTKPRQEQQVGLTTPGASYGGQTKAYQLPQMEIYISPEQQKQLIEAEKQAIAASQQTAAQLQQANAVPGTTQDVQQQNLQVMSQAAGQAQKSQNRLKILQGGPLTASDMARLYQQ